MYLVACKWVSNGTSEYKTPTDYLESSSIPEELNWAASVFEFAPLVQANPDYVDYAVLSDPSSKDKISLNYYARKEGYDSVKALPEYQKFLNDRQQLLSATGLTFTEIEIEVADKSLLTNNDYATANLLFV